MADGYCGACGSALYGCEHDYACERCDQEREALTNTLAGRMEALKNSHPIMRVWLDGLWIDAIWRAMFMPFRLCWSRIRKGR